MMQYGAFMLIQTVVPTFPVKTFIFFRKMHRYKQHELAQTMWDWFRISRTSFLFASLVVTKFVATGNQMRKRLTQLKSWLLTRKIEFVYVWLVKEVETDTVCQYSFTAEIYRPNPSCPDRLAPSGLEIGRLELSKLSSKHSSGGTADNQAAASVIAKLTDELKKIGLKEKFPDSTFLAFSSASI